jgi:hypothetical protein
VLHLGVEGLVEKILGRLIQASDQLRVDAVVLDVRGPSKC